MERALLQQVENVGPPAPVASPSNLVPVVVGNSRYNSIAQNATYDLIHQPTLCRAVLGWHPDHRAEWLRSQHLPPDHPVPPP